MQDCLDAEATLLDLDRYVEYWHNNDTNSTFQEFLGLTDYEFERWGKTSDAIFRDILFCRQRGLDYSESALKLSQSKAKSVVNNLPSAATGNHRRLSSEEIDSASKVNLADFLPSIGEPLKRMGKSFKWTGAGNDSVFIIPEKPYMFKHFSNGRSGNAITFCKDYLGMTFQDAVIALNRGRFVDTFPNRSGASILHDDIERHKAHPSNKVFVAPKRNENNDKLTDYLHKQRGIRCDVLDFFIKEGLVYQTREQTAKGAILSNIAFMCRSLDGKMMGAIKRGFPDKDNAGFKGNSVGSDIGRYGFCYPGLNINSNDSNPRSLFVFEAPIDALSYITMAVNALADKHPEVAMRHCYYATGGTHISGLIHFLTQPENRAHYSRIYLCHDNDAAGLQARIAAIAALEKLGYASDDIRCHMPISKDWNEDLMSGKASREVVKGSFDSMVEKLNEIQAKMANKFADEVQVDLSVDASLIDTTNKQPSYVHTMRSIP